MNDGSFLLLSYGEETLYTFVEKKVIMLMNFSQKAYANPMKNLHMRLHIFEIPLAVNMGAYSIQTIQGNVHSPRLTAITMRSDFQHHANQAMELVHFRHPLMCIQYTEIPAHTNWLLPHTLMAGVK